MGRFSVCGDEAVSVCHAGELSVGRFLARNIRSDQTEVATLVPSRGGAAARGVTMVKPVLHIHAAPVALSLLIHGAVAAVLLTPPVDTPAPLPTITVELVIDAPGRRTAARTAQPKAAGLATKPTQSAALATAAAARPDGPKLPRARIAPVARTMQRATAFRPPRRAEHRTANRPGAAPAVAARPKPAPKKLRSPATRARADAESRRPRPPRSTVARKRPRPTAAPRRTARKALAGRQSAAAASGELVAPTFGVGSGANRVPVYPERARQDGVEGRVVLLVLVGPDGRSQTVKVSRTSGHAVLDRAAVEAVRNWRFRPGTRGGVPVPATVAIPIRFKLE